MLAGVFLLVVLVWVGSAVKVIYDDHLALAQNIVELKNELRNKEVSPLSLRIRGWIVNQDQNHNAIVQMWLGIDNSGDPSTLRDWKIIVKTGNVSREGRHTIGQSALKGGLNLPFLDIEFQRPVGVVADMEGYVTFAIPGMDQRQFDDLHLDHCAALMVTAVDSQKRVVSAEKNIYQTWLEGHEIRPAK